MPHEAVHPATQKTHQDCPENNMKVRVLGDPTALDPDLQESLKKLEESSKDNTGLNFQIAINYGSRDEITRAVRHLAAGCEGWKAGR